MTTRIETIFGVLVAAMLIFVQVAAFPGLDMTDTCRTVSCALGVGALMFLTWKMRPMGQREKLMNTAYQNFKAIQVKVPKYKDIEGIVKNIETVYFSNVRS